MKRNLIKNGKWFAHKSTLHSVKCDQLVNARRQPINLICNFKWRQTFECHPNHSQENERERVQNMGFVIE